MTTAVATNRSSYFTNGCLIECKSSQLIRAVRLVWIQSI